jgi:hypothetical protein
MGRNKASPPVSGFSTPSLTCATHGVRVLLLLAAAGLIAAGCGSRESKPNAAELETAFAIKAGTDTGASAAQSHAAVAAKAIRAADYLKAMEEMELVRMQAGLTPDQYLALNKVSGDVMQKLVTQADKGDAQAKAALERLRQERDKH